VRARDPAGNWSSLSDPVTVTTPPSTTYLFADGFETGDLSSWNLVSNVSAIDSDARSGAWAAHARTTTIADPPSYAYRSLPATQPDLYCRTFVNVQSQGPSALDILKLRTASGSAIAYVVRTSSGLIALRNNVTGVTTTSQTPLSATTWHELELQIRVNGAAGSSGVWFDGAPVPGLSLAANFGSTDLGRVEIGESASSRIYSMLFDDVACSVSYLP
jgi:hypothetical protein